MKTVIIRAHFCMQKPGFPGLRYRSGPGCAVAKPLQSLAPHGIFALRATQFFIVKVSAVALQAPLQRGRL
jgi:hypothetical protein